MKHEVTVTLRPMLYTKTAKQQFDITSLMMKHILNGYKATCVAELTQEHNVHYHCLVDIEGTLNRNTFLDRFRQYNKYFGRKTCKCVMFEESYEKYLTKSYHETTKILSDPFVKDDYKLSDTLNKDLKLKVIGKVARIVPPVETRKENAREAPQGDGVPEIHPLDYGIDFTEQSI